MMHSTATAGALAVVLLARPIVAQYFPPAPENLTVVNSKFNSDVTISFKETSICETTPGVKGYAGYVHLPPGTLNDVGEYQNYSINTFFWFFESRKDPANAPLSIWLNGGPGSSSFVGLLTENGPCNIQPDSENTVLNPYSWNNEVNMLYIDQPDQVGLSYDSLMNGTYNQSSGEVTPLMPSEPLPQWAPDSLIGTFPSFNGSNTANTTANSAKALWHFAQVWFAEFPDYKPNDDRISIWAESYGGRYGPAFSAFFEEQNERIANKTITQGGDTFFIHLDTLGIVNGCVDIVAQALSYPEIAFNNTYGIQTMNQSQYDESRANWLDKGQCRDQILACQALAAQYDPDFTGGNSSVNDACFNAGQNCYYDYAYQYSGRNYYDIAAIDPDPFPPQYYKGYMARADVQQALGARINYTESNYAVSYAFTYTGDYQREDIRGGYLQDLAYLLDNGVKVALMYGDRDYACNWIGGENVSLNTPYSQQDQFTQAGYANIQVNDSYVGGVVRQHGNFSFSRVFESGHEVPAYQPETALQIFNRAIFGMDIATGSVSTSGANGSNYSSSGPQSSFGIKNDVPANQTGICYVLSLYGSCTDDQVAAVLNGSATVRDYVLIDDYTAGIVPNGTGEGVNGTGGTGGAGDAGNGTMGGTAGNGTSTSNGASLELDGCWGMVLVSAMVVGVGMVVV